MPRKRSKPQTPFAKRLEELRFAHGKQINLPDISQHYFADLIGVQGETYGRWERGETEPSLEALQRIRRITRASLDYLISGENVDNIVHFRSRGKPAN